MQSVPEGAAEAGGLVFSCTDILLERGGSTIAKVPDITLQPGDIAALVGPSGFGKTTALMAFALIRPQQDGRLAIAGTDTGALDHQARDRFRARHIGLVFQSFHLVDALSVEENVLLPARCSGWAPDRARANQLLARLGIRDLASRRADRISHGQAQRVAVARALYSRPKLILADEPTSALDDGNAKEMLNLLRLAASIADAGLLITTHDSRILSTLESVHHLEGQSP